MVDDKQKQILLKFAVAILSVMVIFVCYSYALPRTEIEMDTVYHSSFLLYTSPSPRDISTYLMKSSA